MPFQNFNAHSFTQPAILANAPSSPGVYGISSAREWIFIGEAADIRERLLTHLTEVDSMLMSRHPTGFVFELCHPALQMGRQDQLVMEYEPVCNRRFDHRHRFGREGGAHR